MRIVWKHFPLDFHKDAPMAHMASVAAAEQGKFWPFHDRIFGSGGKIQWPFLQRYARELGLDVKRFEEAVTSGRHRPVIDADLAEARSLGITGTPSFFINGRYLSGAKPFEAFAELINAELQRLGHPVPPAAAGLATTSPAGG